MIAEINRQKSDCVPYQYLSDQAKPHIYGVLVKPMICMASQLIAYICYILTMWWSNRTFTTA